MKKFLSKIIKNHFKTILVSLSESKPKNSCITKLEIELKKKCKLGNKNDKIYLIPDEIVTPYVLKKGCWDYEIINFINKHIKSKNNIFFDIGANVGLITKQLSAKNTKIKKFFCFEPNINSYECLTKNLSTNKLVNIYNFGLGLKNQKLKLYKNKMNSGDSSFVKKKGSYEICRINNINNFFRNNEKKIKNQNLIYKSDTQGMDEEIFININKEYFKKIQIAIIEITNFKLVNNNKIKFFSRINSFKILNDKNFNKLSINQIKNKIKNKEEFDLFMSK